MGSTSGPSRKPPTFPRLCSSWSFEANMLRSRGQPCTDQSSVFSRSQSSMAGETWCCEFGDSTTRIIRTFQKSSEEGEREGEDELMTSHLRTALTKSQMWRLPIGIMSSLVRTTAMVEKRVFASSLSIAGSLSVSALPN